MVKEETVKRAAIGFAVIALLFVFAGCPGIPDVSELKAQVETQQLKITELEGQVETLTAERDSLQALLDKEEGGNGEKPPRQGTGTSGQGKPKPPPKQGSGKPPRSGR